MNKNIFNNELNSTPIQQILNLHFDRKFHIPFWVWLLENPQSPIPFPGKTNLYNHDCLHLLLERGLSPQDEAFVIGFTIGNDFNSNWIHVKIFKFFSKYLYPDMFKLSPTDLLVFDLGFNYGKKLQSKNIFNIHLFDISQYEQQTIEQLRKLFKLDLNEIKFMRQIERRLVLGANTSQKKLAVCEDI